jgi:hypothetical protein
MDGKAVIRTDRRGSRAPPGSPPAVWAAFAAQGRWKSWTIAGLLGLVSLQSLAIARLVARPPEVVLVGAAGDATPIRRSVANDALLKFLAERTRPPDVAVVRFTRDFLNLALGVNSSTVDAAWPAALAMMAPELRARVEKEAAEKHLVETWRLARRKTELAFEEIVLEERTPSLLAIRARLSRRTGPLVEGTGPSSTDRVQVDLIGRLTAPTIEQPDGLEVQEWRLTPLPVTDTQAAPRAKVEGGAHAP